MSGKGDRWRQTNFKKFHENIDAIKFRKKKENDKENDNVQVIKRKNKTTYRYS
jgi:hypothetical protein